MRHFDNTSQVTELLEMILGPRERPLVVISTIDAGGEVGFNPQHVQDELRGDADVVTIATGAATYALEESLPPKTHVFNGAARSYPPSFGENPDYQRSILRFPSRHHVDDLINDALAQVTSASILKPAQRAVWVKATVELVSGATGNVALLEDGRRVLINADRLPPEISLVEGLLLGEPVEGWLLDLDLSPEAAEPELGRFTQDSVTLARVIKVTELRATLTLHPLLPNFILRRREVFAEGDDAQGIPVSDVVRVGQTVRVNVDLSAGSLKLSLVNVDQDSLLVEPLPLLRGGQPWLQEGIDASDVEVLAELPQMESKEQSVDASPTLEAEQANAPIPIVEPLETTTSEPGEELVAVQVIHDEMLALRGAFERFSREMRAGTPLETLDQLRDELSSTQAELHRERQGRTELQRMVSRLTQELREARAGAQRQIQTQGGPTSARDEWHDDELWLRHEVQHAWVDRMNASDKKVHPIREYKVGSDFIQSLTQLEDRTFNKAMRAVVDVVSGRVVDIHSRELHQLRMGSGGDDPYVQRSDGAWCWRVSIESKTPQARRLHFWRLPDGGVELSRIVLHDDFQP